MMFELNFKDFKNLSTNKARIMLWNEDTNGFEFILIDENATFRTFIEFDEILYNYCVEIGVEPSIKYLEESKLMFKKKFIDSREHTYEYFPYGLPKEQYDGLVQIENPIDESENTMIEVKDDEFVDFNKEYGDEE